MIRRNPTPVVLTALALACSAGVPSLAAQQGPPPPLPGTPIAFPAPDRFSLPNGLEVVLIQYGTQPVASLRLYLPGGEAAVPAAHAGLAGLTATVLTKGTTSRSAEQISEAIEGVGGSLSAGAGADFLSVTSTVLSEHLPLAFELLGDVVRHATFPESEVELARRQTLSGLQAQRGQPQAVAQRIVQRFAYGAGHPYGTSPSPATVESLGRDEMIAFRDRVMRPQGALLVVAGAAGRAEVERLATEHLGGWEGAGESLPGIPAAAPEAPGEIVLVHRPGSVQSVVLVAHPALRGAEADDPALQVALRVLGGGADARLFRILREEKGWTYGSYAGLSEPVGPGLFTATAEVRNNVADSAVVELLRQVSLLSTDPVPEDELAGARNYLAGSFPLGLETAGQVASQVADALLLGRDPASISSLPARIRTVSAEDVRTAAREHLRAGDAVVVVVSDAAQVLEPLQALGRPVRVIDVDGSPIDPEGVAEVPAAAPALDGSRLQEGTLVYSLRVQGNELGTARNTLSREGASWVATSSVTSALAGNQQSELRFRATDLAPESSLQEQSGGGMQARIELRVEGNRVRGTASLPPQAGGDREIDLDATGLLLPGMDVHALAASELAEGARIRIPYLNVAQGARTVLEAVVTGRETIDVPAGSFESWKVELSGTPQPLLLHLRVEAPHILVRQSFVGQPVTLELTEIVAPGS